MILIDTSAWVEYLRSTGSRACNRVEALAEAGRYATCAAIRMELMAGNGRGRRHLQAVEQLLDKAINLSIKPIYHMQAAKMSRDCRRQGESVRSLLDCLIGAVAIDAGTPVLHQDADFDKLARHTELMIAR